MQNPLIDTDRLAELIGDDNVVVADCRWYLDDPSGGLAAYRRGHLPGAVYVSLDEDLSATHGPGRHPLPNPEEFAGSMAALGIDGATTVVAYDDRGGGIAARLWWMLDNQGHDGTFVLDGGIDAWVAAGHDLSSDPQQPTVRGTLASRPWSRIVDRDDVANRASDRLVIDARSIERYRGDEEPVDPVAGHIPGAHSLPMTENLDEDLRFLPPDVLAERFARAGIHRGDEVISQCGSGVTACHNILALVVAGIGLADLYVGSWSDWSTAGYPVATGDTEA